MWEPYGGTPFREITFDADDIVKVHTTRKTRWHTSITGSVRVRSFLSFAHSRKLKSKAKRTYRPVPIILHLFCPLSEGEKVGSLLEGCTFGIDVYEAWLEVMSLDTGVYDSPFSRELRPSVSFPYDLHIFNSPRYIARIGIDYEDCYSVYEDFTMNFDGIREKQMSHPVLLELERMSHDRWDATAGLILVETTTSDCPTFYQRPGERWTSERMVMEEDLANKLNGTIWVVSHGGANADLLRAIVRGRVRHDALDGVLAHHPYPIRRENEKHQPQKHPMLCIYVYGSM